MPDDSSDDEFSYQQDNLVREGDFGFPKDTHWDNDNNNDIVMPNDSSDDEFNYQQHNLVSKGDFVFPKDTHQNNDNDNDIVLPDDLSDDEFNYQPLPFMTELNRHSRISVILEDFGHPKFLCLRSLNV